MDQRRRAGEIWYAARGHRMRQRGCCLWDLFVFVLVLLALRACIG